MLTCSYLTPRTTNSKEGGTPARTEALTSHFERAWSQILPLADRSTQKRHHKQVVSYTH
jgi:hypothetical protein